MGPKLLHARRERPKERAERRFHERRSGERHAEPRVIVIEGEPARDAERPRPTRLAGDCDPVAERVRAAGGPLDEAVYTCCCGYLFSAPVSTSVSCPHCGTDQAW